MLLQTLTLAVLAAVVVRNAWREHETQKKIMITKANILTLLSIIVALQKTRVNDTANIAALKAEVETLKANNAELSDPELIAAVDAAIDNAAVTPPPVTEPVAEPSADTQAAS